MDKLVSENNAQKRGEEEKADARLGCVRKKEKDAAWNRRLAREVGGSFPPPNTVLGGVPVDAKERKKGRLPSLYGKGEGNLLYLKTKPQRQISMPTVLMEGKKGRRLYFRASGS